MDVRAPYAAGLFYVGYEEGLKRDVKRLLGGPEQKGSVDVRGVVVPHAGYEYSGKVAGSVYSRINVPKRMVIIGPNHSGFGYPVSIEDRGFWKTPLGDVEIDHDLASSIKSHSPSIKVSRDAHRLEHSVEVQLPFLQVMASDGFKFVPMVIKGGLNLDDCREIGLAIAAAIKETDDDVLIIASTDFTHYEPEEYAREMDKLAIDAILEMDPLKLLQTVFENDITMCGPYGTAAMLYASLEQGAKQAELVKYATSADFSRDTQSVVGYGGLIVR